MPRLIWLATFAAAAGLSVLRGFLIGFGVALWETMMMELVPDRLLSRVVSLDYFGSYGLMPVGFIDGELRPERRLPTGRVTLLLADVEDSTGHLTDLGDRYQRLLADVRRLLRTATRREIGRAHV